MSRTLWLVLAVCGAVAGFFVVTQGESAAEVDAYSEIREAMHAEIQALPGYEIEPKTFDRYFATAHENACETVFVVKNLDPAIEDARIVYKGEVYRGIIDSAFTEGRTDLTDVVTRGYMKLVTGK